MAVRRIEVHLSRNKKDFDHVIEAFGGRFVFHGIISKDVKEKDVVAVYLPEKGGS